MMQPWEITAMYKTHAWGFKSLKEILVISLMKIFKHLWLGKQDMMGMEGFPSTLLLCKNQSKMAAGPNLDKPKISTFSKGGKLVEKIGPIKSFTS